MAKLNMHIIAIGIVTTLYIMFHLLHLLFKNNDQSQKDSLQRKFMNDYRSSVDYIQRYPRGVPYVLFEYDMMNIINVFRMKYKRRVSNYEMTKYLGKIIEAGLDKEHELYDKDKPSMGHTFIHSLNK